jgi:hypothetical protein
MSSLRLHLLAVAGVLFVVIIAYTAPYGFNVSSLFHIDRQTADVIHVPSGFIVLDVPGYDGMNYFAIAKSVPLFLQSSSWPPLGEISFISYSYQRILLPILAFILALGSIPLLPWSFLVINLCALLLGAYTLLRRDHILAAWALILCPAAMVSLHFSLAEPLTLCLLTLFLLRVTQQHKVDAISALLLSFAVLSREVNILFVGTMGLTMLVQRKWNSILWLTIPIVVFALYHGLLFAMFHQIPFLTSAQKHALPFMGLVEVIQTQGLTDLKTLSSLMFLCTIILPLTFILIRDLRQKQFDSITIPLTLFLLFLFLMPNYIWGSITSVGRVLTPLYPLGIMASIRQKDRWASFALLGMIATGVMTTIGLAMSVHPFTLS